METIEDIVREMREHDNIVLWKEYITYGYTGPYFEQDVYETKLHDIADRIEKACNRLEADKTRIIAELNEVRELNRKCCDENERLKAALQPVLDCDVATESYLAQSEVVWIAQRIYKEGQGK